MKTTLIVLAAVIAMSGVAVALDWTFWTRFLTIGNQTALTYPGWIAQTAKVVGNFSEELPTTDPAGRTLSDTAIVDLVTYAEELGSFSLVVHHNGAIQFETYWR